MKYSKQPARVFRKSRKSMVVVAERKGSTNGCYVQGNAQIKARLELPISSFLWLQIGIEDKPILPSLLSPSLTSIQKHGFKVSLLRTGMNI